MNNFEREILRQNRPYGGYTDADLRWIESEISRLTALKKAILRERKEREGIGVRIEEEVFKISLDAKP